MRKIIKHSLSIATVLMCSLLVSFQNTKPPKIKVTPNMHIAMVGGNLGSRMLFYDWFETELHSQNPNKQLIVRNMCDPGDTPGFRPTASRFDPWAFPGAAKFQTEFANNSDSEGHFETPDQWLNRLKTDVILGFFGYSESFAGIANLANYKAELQAFIDHTLAQEYNETAQPKLVLITPIAFEDYKGQYDLPQIADKNKNLELYSQAIKAIALKNKLLCIDIFSISKTWYANQKEPLTIDGFQLNKKGYQILGKYLVDEIFENSNKIANVDKNKIYTAVEEKNWFWHNDYKIPNQVHVYGRRYNPFGPDNYPAEIEKTRQMTAIRDTAIWMIAQVKIYDIASADANTRKLEPVKTNYNPKNNGSLQYLYGEDALKSFTMAPGFKIELFASEKEFPDLANPVQMSFDNKGRLWVACMPTYPHYKPGDSKPNDKLIILEDTNKDGKADKQTVFADGLHLPLGFEFAPEGVYLSSGLNLKLLKDINNDDKVDEIEIILSGFDDHDTHHNSSAFCADPSGAIYTGEGVFLHTSVETAYGTVRATNGGFYRYSPQLHKLERVAQVPIPNPWGIAFDHWGQGFYAETSGPDVRWMLPGSNLPRYGEGNDKGKTLIEENHKVRPTSGLEFVHSRHFPDHMQGDMLINNTIGFLGMKQHQMINDGTGFLSKFRQDLVKSSDPNFRPVDMEFAPDGSLYLIDWHNVLIGHMQHNARDPLRDHVHGRVYRITYPDRPLVPIVQVDDASIETLLDNLKLPEYRTRYRSRRELRERNTEQVLQKAKIWQNNLDKFDANYEHHLLEALWLSWALNKVDQPLLTKLLNSKDERVRAAAVQVVRYTGHQVKNQAALLAKAATDPSGRVRLTAIQAASWIEKPKAMQVLNIAKTQPQDEWIKRPLQKSLAHVQGKATTGEKDLYSTTKLRGADYAVFNKGKLIYAKEGYCITCHQANGQGLPASGFPTLANTPYVNGSEERLIKIILKGIMGPMQVAGKNYTGQVPMTPFESLLKDDEVAAVATYIRNSFGNNSSLVKPEVVRRVRAQIKNKKDFYNVDQLLQEHPLEKE